MRIYNLMPYTKRLGIVYFKTKLYFSENLISKSKFQVSWLVLFDIMRLVSRGQVCLFNVIFISVNVVLNLRLEFEEVLNYILKNASTIKCI